MSDKDTISHDYMSDKQRFADAFNYYIYGGKQVINPGDLHDEDVTETAIVNGTNGILTSKKTRDLLKAFTVKRDENTRYVLLGIENQSQINYAMPVRNNLYDALNYWSQVSDERKRFKESGAKLSPEEYVSGFSKDSKLIPVITLVINWSAEEWQAPTKLSDMMTTTDEKIRGLINDYEIRLIDPYKIDDFGKFHTKLGDVLEFIANQGDDDYLAKKVKHNVKNWMWDIDSVNVINTFAGAEISIEGAKEGLVDMCRATEAIREEGIEQGIDKHLVKMICKKLSKGKNAATIIVELEEDDEQKVLGMIEIAKRFAPKYDSDDVFEAYLASEKEILC